MFLGGEEAVRACLRGYVIFSSSSDSKSLLKEVKQLFRLGNLALAHKPLGLWEVGQHVRPVASNAL